MSSGSNDGDGSCARERGISDLGGAKTKRMNGPAHRWGGDTAAGPSSERRSA
jgi:hypothetical protein